MKGDHEQFMAMAIEEARIGVRAGEKPFGSVVVRDGEVVGRGRNVTNSTLDPTAHAETQALRSAAENLKASGNLKEPRLDGCTLYTTCDPCPMCSGAILYANVETLVIGARFPSIHQASGGQYDLHEYRVERLLELTGFKLNIVTGVMQEECEQMYRDWQGWGPIRD